MIWEWINLGIWIPRIAIAWLVAFPVIVVINAELVLPYLMITLYLGMTLFGWAIAASLLGGFVNASIFVAFIGILVGLNVITSNRRYRAENHGELAGLLSRRGRVESLPTYCSLGLSRLTGSLAGAVLGLAPLIFNLIHRLNPDSSVSPSMRRLLNFGSSSPDVLFLVLYLAAAGFYMSGLRRNHGFAKRYVWPLVGYKRERPRGTKYDTFCLYWWPALTFIVIAILDRGLMSVLMQYIFIWAFSGLLYQNLWSSLQVLLLRLFGCKLTRRLDLEYAIRLKLEGEQDLHACTYGEIKAYHDGAVQVEGHFDSERSMGLIEGIINKMVNRSSGRVTLVQE